MQIYGMVTKRTLLRNFQDLQPPSFKRGGTNENTLVDGILYRRWEDVQGGGAHRRLQLVLPASLVHEVLTGVHNSPAGGHMGVKKTLEKIGRVSTGPGRGRMWSSGAIAANCVIPGNR